MNNYMKKHEGLGFRVKVKLGSGARGQIMSKGTFIIIDVPLCVLMSTQV